MIDLSCNKPVVLIIFARPDTTQQVFDVIKQAKPPILFVIADAPRVNKPGEDVRCTESRSIIDQVDWECDVRLNYAEQNMGCKDRIVSGLDWVFEQVDEAIILEDDCVPNLTFFKFCEEMLDRYRDDKRVMTISGNNFLFNQVEIDESYYFSKYIHTWGWATWKRAWALYDRDMQSWAMVKQKNILLKMFKDKNIVYYWYRRLEGTINNIFDAWDFRWILSCWINHGLTIVPKYNQVTVVGFGNYATNTTKKTDNRANVPTRTLEFPLENPKNMIINYEADEFEERYVYKSIRKRPLKNKIISFIKKYITNHQ